MFTICSFASEEDANEEWEYEFEEFDDEYFVLTPERQQEYIDGASSAVYTPSIAYYDNYMEIYYDNLTRNLGQNYKGSCGYVAIGMLLSYYDTYLNDDIIPEQYDVRGEGTGSNLINWQDSPGVLKDEITNGKELSSIDYYNIIKAQSEYSLHAKLITLGHNRMYYNSLSKMPAGTTFGMLISIMKAYLKSYRGYSNDQYTINYEYALIADEDNDVRDFVIENIQSGKPVLLAIKGVNANGKKEGHVVIAYDYDEVTDEIFCHFGWGADKTHITPESEGLPLYKAAFTVDFDLPQSHSYNYVENKNQPNEKFYCSCYFSCHPEHEHTYSPTADGSYHTYSCSCRLKETPNFEHSLYISEINEDGHRYKCSTCNYESELIEHNMRFYLYSTPTQHGERCVDCEYVDEDTLETHSYDYWLYLNSTTHVSECGCGARGTTTASHVYTFPDSDGWMTCIGCGYTKIFGSDSGLIIMSTTKVSSNGSRIISDGTIMLVDEDIEAYLDGTLVFYDKDNLPMTQ